MIYVTFQRAEPSLASNARSLPPDVQLSLLRACLRRDCVCGCSRLEKTATEITCEFDDHFTSHLT